MEGSGSITVSLTADDDGRMAFVEVSDTGKGIARKNFKTVFNPGFTTKSRGWGLGLTLAKRIVEQYHGGVSTCFAPLRAWVALSASTCLWSKRDMETPAGGRTVTRQHMHTHQHTDAKNA